MYDSKLKFSDVLCFLFHFYCTKFPSLNCNGNAMNLHRISLVHFNKNHIHIHSEASTVYVFWWRKNSVRHRQYLLFDVDGRDDKQTEFPSNARMLVAFNVIGYMHWNAVMPQWVRYGFIFSCYYCCSTVDALEQSARRTDEKCKRTRKKRQSLRERERQRKCTVFIRFTVIHSKRIGFFCLSMLHFKHFKYSSYAYILLTIVVMRCTWCEERRFIATMPFDL